MSDRVKPVICNFQHLGTLMLSSEHQSAWMSKFTNDGLTQSGTGCIIVVPTHMATVGVKGLIITVRHSDVMKNNNVYQNTDDMQNHGTLCGLLTDNWTYSAACKHSSQLPVGLHYTGHTKNSPHFPSCWSCPGLEQVGFCDPLRLASLTLQTESVIRTPLAQDQGHDSRNFLSKS